MSYLSQNVVFLVFLLANVVASANHYCSISPYNTMCIFKPNAYGAACKAAYPMSLSPGEKQTIVQVHNDYRRKVAYGHESSGYPGPQPPAANMRELTWDDELAQMAQAHANQCVFRHDANRDVGRFLVGQNLASTLLGTPSFAPAYWKSMIAMWYNEVARVNRNAVGGLNFSPDIGHYTQLIWAQTHKIGCALASFYDNSYRALYVCNYGPTGNYQGAPIYRAGRTASACPLGTLPRNGLCA